jgi:hypothetical protein
MHRHSIRSSLARLAALGIALLAAFFLAEETASACSFAANPAHTLDANAQATDTAAPAAPTLTVVRVVRGKGPERESLCSSSASSCDDLGQIELQMAATDDQTPATSMGFHIELAGGALPSGLTLPDFSVRGSRLLLVWIDGASDDQEAFSFVLAISAVDLAGNMGPATTIQVSDPGSDSGCSIGVRNPLRTPWPTIIAILLIGFMLRRWRQVTGRRLM